MLAHSVKGFYWIGTRYSFCAWPRPALHMPRFAPLESVHRGSTSWWRISPRSMSRRSSTRRTAHCSEVVEFDGAIHRAAGPQLLRECEGLGGCETGSAKVTQGYRLKASHVIHAVGPVWSGGNKGEHDLLASCYRTALSLAAQHRLASIAFPAISTGVYRFPPERAARIAVGTVASELRAAPRGIERVVFCCFSPIQPSITSKRWTSWDLGEPYAGYGDGGAAKLVCASAAQPMRPGSRQVTSRVGTSRSSF